MKILFLTVIAQFTIVIKTYSQKIENISICDVYYITGKKNLIQKLDSLIQREDVYGKEAIGKFRLIKASALYYLNQKKVSSYHRDKSLDNLKLNWNLIKLKLKSIKMIYFNCPFGDMKH